MELKYIWVKKYNIIIEQGFSLSHSGSDDFQYEAKNLHVKKRPSPILNFGKQIMSITAIAGQNGSGKSSFCEVILRAIATLTNGSLGSREFQGIICFDTYILHHEEIEIKNKQEIETHGYTLLPYKETPFESFLGKPDHRFTNLGFIFYSNVLDWRSGFAEHNLSNMSTQYLIYDDLYRGPHYPDHEIRKNSPYTYGREGTINCKLPAVRGAQFTGSNTVVFCTACWRI
jgi:energy-coupling factor transporter ATP-binding protein EcfA2